MSQYEACRFAKKAYIVHNYIEPCFSRRTPECIVLGKRLNNNIHLVSIELNSIRIKDQTYLPGGDL